MTPDDAQRHDRFLRLFLANEDALRGFVRALVPEREAAREVMQEVAAVLWRKFDALDNESEFRRWAFGVARLEALAARRDHARDRHVFDPDLVALLADEAEREADHAEPLREALARCLERLPAHQRRLLDQAYGADERIDQLAARLGRSAMSLYKTLHRVRLALQACTDRELRRA